MQSGMSTRGSKRLGSTWTIVHDFAFVPGGAEWVSGVFSTAVVPGAPIRFLAGHPNEFEGRWPTIEATQILPSAVNKATYRLMTPLYPAMLSRLDPIQGDVIASSYAFAHLVPATGRKVVYCHTPLRQAWSGAYDYQKTGPWPERLASTLLSRPLAAIDRRGAQRATLYIATSMAVQKRIHRYYGMEAVPIVPPPLDDSVFKLQERVARADRYLWVGRIVEPYKRLSLVLEAFRGMPGKQLMVVGDGRDRKRLEATASSNVTFRGWLTPNELAAAYASSRAVIFASEDDFGLVPVEAMACGTPSIAFAAGGALDTVTDELTGILFQEQTPNDIKRALVRFESRSWDPNEVAKASDRYSVSSFVESMRQILASIQQGGNDAETAARYPRPQRTDVRR